MEEGVEEGVKADMEEVEGREALEDMEEVEEKEAL